MKTKTSIWLYLVYPLVVYLASGLMVFGQNQTSFRQLSVKNGLSQNSTTSIAQDSIGNLWIATQDGLNRYDGRNFSYYPFQFTDITRPNYSTLGQIYIDKQGQVWVIPNDNVPYRFDSEKNQFEIPFDITDAYHIFQDSNLNYWISTFNNVLFFINGKTKEVRDISFDKTLNGRINTIEQIDKETLILLGNNQLIEVDINSKRTAVRVLSDFFEKNQTTNFSSYSIDANGLEWFGSYGNGVFVWDASQKCLIRHAFRTFEGELPENLNVLDLLFDKKGRLWVATYGKGLYQVDFANKKTNRYVAEKQNPRALHYNDILCVYEDYLGTLWFGTDGAGLSYYDEHLEKFNSFTNNQTPDNINIDVVRAIAVDDSENIWIGTSGKGLTKYNSTTNIWKTFSIENSDLSSNRIISLLEHEGDLLVGTQNQGLSIIGADGKIDNYSKRTGFNLNENTIWNIFKDSNSRIWLGTRGNGLLLYEKGDGISSAYAKESTINRLSECNIRVITEGINGDLWLGTDSNGLFKFNPASGILKNYKKDRSKNSISSNSIKSVYFDSYKKLWIGTAGSGLDVLDTTSDYFFNYNTKDGLANNVIYGILPDKANKLWLSSNRGISSFEITEVNPESPSIVNYTNYDGLATEFNTGAYTSDNQGNLYFGGLDGFYWFDPNTIKDNTVLPKTAITRLEVLNSPYPIKKETNLEYDQNTIAFTFSSMQFSLPEKNNYQYKLVNYDLNWIDAGNKNYVRYTRLPPGDYIFQVKSSNYDGVWNDTPEQFVFTIKAPWYFTTLAKVIYFLLFIGAFLGIYSYLKWRWTMKLNLKLKEDEADRLQKLNNFRSKLYTNIAHEFKTPLTLIAGPLDEQLSKGNLTENDYSNFAMAKRNTQRMTSLVDQLLQLSKLEEGKLKKNSQKADLGLFLHMITKSFEYHFKLKQIRYAVSIDDTGNVWYDEDIVEKIVNNLLSNAFKYTPHNGKCTFQAKHFKDKIIITIENNFEKGSKLKSEKLFDRFYQSDEFTEGIGVGLSLVKELVTFYKGEITAKLSGLERIEFKVQLPVNNEVLQEVDSKIPHYEKEIITLKDHTFSAANPLTDAEFPILLIIEDHAEVRSFIRRSFRQQYHILEAENGKSGLKIALEHIPDIIVSDIRMPKMNGIQLCGILKKDERTSHIPIILLTANDTQEMELKALASGADNFVSKPFKIALLKQRIANLIAIRKALRKHYSNEFVLKPKEIAITSSDEIFLNKLQEILDNHLDNPDFNATSFSQKANMSRMQLHRKLQVYTGLSTTAFLRSQRLIQAKNLLKTTDLTINEIAYSVGFSTPTYFMKCFKKQFKMTPSQFVAQHQA